MNWCSTISFISLSFNDFLRFFQRFSTGLSIASRSVFFLGWFFSFFSTVIATDFSIFFYTQNKQTTESRYRPFFLFGFATYIMMKFFPLYISSFLWRRINMFHTWHNSTIHASWSAIPRRFLDIHEGGSLYARLVFFSFSLSLALFMCHITHSFSLRRLLSELSRSYPPLLRATSFRSYSEVDVSYFLFFTNLGQKSFTIVSTIVAFHDANVTCFNNTHITI